MQDANPIQGMHVGEFVTLSEQFMTQSDEDLIFCKQLGIEYVDVVPRLIQGVRCWGLEEDGHWNAEALIEFRESIESYGLKLAATHLPLYGPYGISRQRWSSIMLGTPERDRDIEHICRCIEAAGKAGIPLLLYALSSLGVVRNPGWTEGRGGTMSRYFDYEELKDKTPDPAAPISVEQSWERIAYFVEHIVPVAEEYKVKMGFHQQDPPMPSDIAFRGIPQVLSTVDGLKRFIDLHPSPYHGLSFCQGCIAEASTDPEQVYEAIRYFGNRKRIFWVHFRNIRGGYLKFEETFPDEGDVDMFKALRTYKEIGYNGVLTPDHVPYSSLDTRWGHRGHAFSIGYIKGLIQAVQAEG